MLNFRTCITLLIVLLVCLFLPVDDTTIFSSACLYVVFSHRHQAYNWPVSKLNCPLPFGLYVRAATINLLFDIRPKYSYNLFLYDTGFQLLQTGDFFSLCHTIDRSEVLQKCKVKGVPVRKWHLYTLDFADDQAVRRRRC